MRYFVRIKDVDKAVKSPPIIQSLHRFQIEPKFITERWDKENRIWVDNPNLIRFTGIGGDSDYLEINKNYMTRLIGKDFFKGGASSGNFGHSGRVSKTGGSPLNKTFLDYDIDATFPSKQSFEDSIKNGMIDYDEEYIVAIGNDLYEIRTEGWWDSCLESRGLCTTSKESVARLYKEVTKKEYEYEADILGYLPNADNSPDYGVTYIGRLLISEGLK